MATSPTQNSLKKLRSEGYTVGIVEFWNSFTRRRQDLFGFGDLLAFRKDEFCIVQTTSASNFSARKKKIRANDVAKEWVNSGGHIIIHGWRKVKGRWTCREEVISTWN